MGLLSMLCCGRRLAHFSLTKQDRHAQKVSDIKQWLMKMASGRNAFNELLMIDHIQRLGLGHLFRNEIRDALERHYVEWYSSGRISHCHNLHEDALRFRLLRKQGYHVPADIFEKYRDREGKFEFGVSIEGLKSLFEASHMSIEEEDILDEANAFTKEKLLENVDKPQHANKISGINRTLKLPYHKTISKFTAMDLLQGIDYSSKGWLTELGVLAKLDIEMAVVTYKNEFLHFSKWWKEVGIAEDLKMARDQPLKWYIWAVAAVPEPQYCSEERLDIAKPISLVYVVDDLFDVYGNLNELSLFTQVVNSWDLAGIEELPEYMRSTWRTVFDTTNDISHKIWMKHGWNPKCYLKKAWADFCNACLIEARRNASGHLPTTLEYLKIGIVTSGVPLILCHSFFLLADNLNTATLNLLNDDPKIISSVATILRLSDDLGSAKDEGQDGYDGSYVNCYMKENEGASLDQARGHVDKLISDAWKELNKECIHLQPHPFSSSHDFGRLCLNSARMVPVMYGYDEHGALPGLNKFIELLLLGN